MATLQTLLVLLASFSWIYMLSGLSKEQKNRTVVVQEGKGMGYAEKTEEVPAGQFSEAA